MPKGLKSDGIFTISASRKGCEDWEWKEKGFGSI
jgi:hypothetical protein